MKTLLLIFALSSLAYGQWSWAVDPAPTLAPADCKCVDCKCDPCDCHAKAKPVVSVRKTFTPAEASVIVRAAKGKEAFQCSGTAICDHTVLTCWHILRERDFLNITVNGKPARVLRFDAKSDVALLTTEEQLKPVKVASEPLRAGEACTAYGYEYDKAGKLWKFPANLVQHNRYRGFPNQSTRGRDPVKSGRSGGGLFNAAGELVGVCSAADGQEGLYCGLEAVRSLVYGETQKIAPKAIEPKPSTPNIVNEWMRDPNCNRADGQCPLIKKLAPPNAKAAPKVESRPAPIGSSRAYYTPARRWGRR